MASSSIAAAKSSEHSDMSQETAKRLFENGAILVFLNLPPKSVFGIDMKVVTVGEKFRGIKMIPPGIHFIYYSTVSKDGATAPRSGFFHYFKKQEIVLKKWDRKNEELLNEIPTEEEIQRIKDNLQELDQYLGPYPYEDLKNWNRLTCNINEDLLERLQPECGQINSVTQLIPQSFPQEQTKEEEGESSRPRSHHQGLEEKYLPNMKQLPGTEIRFTTVPTEFKIPKGSDASQVTQHSMDSTYTLEQLLAAYKKEEDILGELQMALICFLIGHVYDAFEHWKKLLQVLCSVDKGLQKHSDLLTTFLTLFHYQIKEIPTDFFIDITGDNNFLVHTLQIFFENVNTSNTSAKFRKFVADFKRNITKTYKWDFDYVPLDERPVIVET